MPESLYNEILTMDSSTRRRKSLMCGVTEVDPPNHYNGDPTSQIASLSMYIVCRQCRVMMRPLGRHLHKIVLPDQKPLKSGIPIKAAHARRGIIPLPLSPVWAEPYPALLQVASSRSLYIVRWY